jgi:hypothetical protein
MIIEINTVNTTLAANVLPTNKETEMQTNVSESRKRKNEPVITKSKSTSSIDSIGVDLDSEHSSKSHVNTKRVCKPSINDKMTVNTFEESFTLYKTFAPIGQILPELSNPPDVPIFTTFINEMTTDAELHFMASCTEANPDSKFSLVTLHSNGNTSIPKCHLAIQICPNSIDLNMMKSIPKNSQFMYELLLVDDALAYYKNHLATFVKWVIDRQAAFMITIPDILSKELSDCLESIKIHEICRPFIPIASTSSTT